MKTSAITPRIRARRRPIQPVVKADALNPAASAITARYAYDGFGKEIGVSGADSGVNSFRFSTKQLDVETGMNYYGLRHYDASKGRWINRDPIKELGGFNVYSMVLNDICNKYDVLGLQDAGLGCWCQAQFSGAMHELPNPQQDCINGCNAAYQDTMNTIEQARMSLRALRASQIANDIAMGLLAGEITAASKFASIASTVLGGLINEMGRLLAEHTDITAAIQRLESALAVRTTQAEAEKSRCLNNCNTGCSRN